MPLNHFGHFSHLNCSGKQYCLGLAKPMTAEFVFRQRSILIRTKDQAVGIADLEAEQVLTAITRCVELHRRADALFSFVDLLVYPMRLTSSVGGVTGRSPDILALHHSAPPVCKV